VRRLSHAKTRDGNEKPIVDALEAIGAKVQRLDDPCDLLVAYEGRLKLLEVKPPKRKHRADQQEQRDRQADWPHDVVTNEAEALAVIGIVPRGGIET